MCGIAGIVAGNGRPVDERALRAMTRALEARGPDDEGFHVAAPVGLGHRRLSIIDVEGGRQPLFSEDRKVAVVVNGEFYNFAPLRSELEGKGYRFATRSDSEVLAHGYVEWGDEVLERLEGMFALAVWDADARRMLLARDRMGEKPLFWANLPGGGLAFASELRALKRCPGIDLGIDPGSLARYLVYEYVPAPAAMICGASKLPPGNRLVFEPGLPPQVAHYWDMPFGETPVTDPEIGAEQIRTELRRSVQERLVSDVPLGVFLSGGIDSSTIAVLASEVRGRELDTFSIGFGDPSFDETSYARQVAQLIGSRHREERLTPRDVQEVLSEIGNLLDEPIGDGSIVPTHLLSRFARRHVKVALGGDGGDELFSGYPTFLAERVASALFDRAPAVLGRAAASLGRAIASRLPVSQSYMSHDFKLKQFLKGAGESGARRHQAWLGSLAPGEAMSALVPDLRRAAGADLYDVIDERLEASRARAPADLLMYFYARGYMAESVLTKVDRASMAVGLEVRAPMLDREVVALACRISPDLRCRGLQTKFLLKRAMRGLLPDEILHRKKQGFGMPIGRWLRDELRSLLEEDLSVERLRADGLFEPAVVRRMVDEHVSGQIDHRKPLWTLLAFQGWYSAWQEPVRE